MRLAVFITCICRNDFACVLQNSAMELRRNVVSAIAQVDDGFNSRSLSDMPEHERVNIQKVYRETLHQCYSFGFEVRSYCHVSRRCDAT